MDTRSMYYFLEGTFVMATILKSAILNVTRFFKWEGGHATY